MAENNPSVPPGGVPPKPQTKKETVRISLPPKPTATIKLPTLPAGGPAPAPAAAPGVVAPPPPAGTPATLRPATAPAPAARPPGAPAARPAPAMASIRRISPLDTGLAIAAAVLGLAAIGYLFLGILSMN